MIAFSEDSDRIHPGQFRLFSELFPASAVWDARLIPGTKHFLFEDRPEAALELLLAFVGGASPPPQEETPRASTPVPAMLSGARLQADVATYSGFGDHRTGSPASAHSLAWMDETLRAAGYSTRRSPLPLIYHAVDRAELRIGERTLSDGLPVWPVVYTGSDGLRGRLVPADDAMPGDIALVRLPFSPYASVFDPAYRPIFVDLLRRRPAGIVAVTEHGSGEVVALNVRDAGETGRAANRSMPALLLGQKHLRTLEAGLGQTAELVITGAARPASDANLIAEAGPANGPLLVISTPRNGWFAAGGERGPGVAMTLGLARWLRAAHPDMRVRIVISSHHELGGLGMKAILDGLNPSEPIALWLHLGANIATREAIAGNNGLSFGDEANRQRGLGVSASHLTLARSAFAAVPGLAVEPLDSARAVGEAALIARAGNFPVAGLVGYQLAHHTRFDSAVATSAPILENTASALADFLTRVIQQQRVPHP
jgi:hypothetical protein